MTPDARLSAAERAALADLEAAALADDPTFASRLKHDRATDARRAVHAVNRIASRAWVRVLCLRWWGLVMMVAGLAAVVAGLSISILVSIAGTLVAGVGLRILAEVVIDRNVRRRGSPIKEASFGFEAGPDDRG